MFESVYLWNCEILKRWNFESVSTFNKQWIRSPHILRSSSTIQKQWSFIGLPLGGLEIQPCRDEPVISTGMDQATCWNLIVLGHTLSHTSCRNIFCLGRLPREILILAYHVFWKLSIAYGSWSRTRETVLNDFLAPACAIFGGLVVVQFPSI